MPPERISDTFFERVRTTFRIRSIFPRVTDMTEGTVMAERVVDLTTERLALCRWSVADADGLVQLCADERVMHYFPKPLSREEAEVFLGRIMEEFDRRGYGLWQVRRWADDRFLGFVGLHDFAFPTLGMQGTEIGWRLLSEAWGQGYATEAATAALAYACEQGIETVYSFTAVVNTPSQRVMQRLGMERIGEFDHPALPAGDWLQRHVLYRIDLRKD